MKVILIQGAENTGKTTLCNQIDEWLQKEFIDEYFEENHEKIEKMVVTKDISLDTDFFAIYDIKQIKNINHKRIIINSLSDEIKQIEAFKGFIEEHVKDDIPISDVDTEKQNTEGLKYSDKIMERISQSYTPSQKPDLLITVIRPLDTNKRLYNKMKNILGLNLSDLEEVNLSPTYHENTSKDILLIKLEKTPLELIKEEIRKIF